MNRTGNTCLFAIKVTGLLFSLNLYILNTSDICIFFISCVISQGFVPKREFSKEMSERLEQMFYVGQVVCCIIKSWNPDDRRLILSLKVCISLHNYFIITFSDRNVITSLLYAFFTWPFQAITLKV